MALALVLRGKSDRSWRRRWCSFCCAAIRTAVVGFSTTPPLPLLLLEASRAAAPRAAAATCEKTSGAESSPRRPATRAPASAMLAAAARVIGPAPCAGVGERRGRLARPRLQPLLGRDAEPLRGARGSLVPIRAPIRLVKFRPALRLKYRGAHLASNFTVSSAACARDESAVSAAC